MKNFTPVDQSIPSGRYGDKMVKILLVLLVCFLIWLGISPPSYALIRTIKESPDRVLVQSRHQLKDQNRSVWQVILFARHHELQLRLVGFPDQYHFRHPDPLLLETVEGAKFLALDDFPKGKEVTNVGQFDLLPLSQQLPKDRRLILTIPLIEADLELVIPSEVVLEWQSVIQQPL